MKTKVRLSGILLPSLLFLLSGYSGSDKSANTTQPFGTAFKEAEGSDQGVSHNIVDKFRNPDLDARPMARMWFPDAGAGSSAEGLAMVEKQIRDIANGGFGGVEIAFLADNSSYNNEDAKVIGWGSENWKKVLKQVLRTANSIEGGFKVDITLTAHWPPVVNNIDPNDDEASQNAVYAYRKITTADIKAGKIDLPVPETKTSDNFRSSPAPFLFNNKYVAATIAQVTGFDAQGNPVYKLDAMKDMSSYTSRKTTIDETAGLNENGIVYAGYQVGIPDRAYCDEHGLNYKEEIIAKFGPDPVNEDFEGKIDEDGNRKRMADWQYLYETDIRSVSSGLSASEGDELAVGDYVIFGSYYRGTGQVMSGGDAVVMYNRCYVMDYFSREGVQKIFEFWNNHILDAEMRALLSENGRKNGTSLFEDSIEMQSEGPRWTHDLFDEFKNYKGYDVITYAPLLASGSVNWFDDTGKAAKIIEDYNAVLGELFTDEHAASIKNWAATFNYTYRAQAYPVPGLESDQAALAVDIPEGDNGTSGDGLRRLSSAVNMSGGKMLSMEATTFAANINSKWGNVMKVLNANFSDGVNRVILHGTPFARTFNGYYSDWPGWNFFKHMTNEDLNGSGFSSWNGRQIYWEDVETASGYIARTQAVMQNGVAKVDLAVIGTDPAFGESGRDMLKKLLDRGYSYNIMNINTLMLEGATVSDHSLVPDGPAYKALVVVNGTADMTADMQQKILQFAQNGLPVFLNAAEISGTGSGNADAAIPTDLLSGESPGITSVADEAELLSSLLISGIRPSASYDQPGLEASHRLGSEGNYYFFYNDYEKVPYVAGNAGDASGAEPESRQFEAPPAEQGFPSMPPFQGGPAGEGGPGMGRGAPGGQRESEGFKYKDDIGNSIHTKITMEGGGKPFILDAWTGNIMPVALYKEEEGRITMDISLIGREAMIVCIAGNTTDFPDAGTVHAIQTSGGEVVYNEGMLKHRAGTAGNYTVTLDDNTKTTFRVKRVPDTIILTQNWDLRLISYGPEDERAAKLSIDNNYDYSVDPSISEATEINLTDVDLVAWRDLPVGRDQLVKLGVDGMNKVSGIGYYTTTFELSDEWNGNVGAYMQFDHHSDMIAEVIINGIKIDDVNQISDITDVGRLLKKGTNTIMIKLDSTLQNRDPAAIEKTLYGLNSVRILPYYETVLSD